VRQPVLRHRAAVNLSANFTIGEGGIAQAPQHSDKVYFFPVARALLCCRYRYIINTAMR
jgi:hypothetical protein